MDEHDFEPRTVDQKTNFTPKESQSAPRKAKVEFLRWDVKEENITLTNSKLVNGEFPDFASSYDEDNDPAGAWVSL